MLLIREVILGIPGDWRVVPPITEKPKESHVGEFLQFTFLMF